MDEHSAELDKGELDKRQLRASDADRERIARALQAAFSDGRLTMAELEQRLDTVYGARTFAELEPVTADLPGTARSPESNDRPVSRDASSELIGGTPGSALSIAIMSGTERKGAWVVPAQHNSYAFWGGIDIDLRQARFAARYTTITAVAIMGGIDIVVPDDIHVEVTGFGFMGAFESRGNAPEDPEPQGPVVRINGLAFWGAVEVKRKPRKPGKKQKLPPGTDD